MFLPPKKYYSLFAAPIVLLLIEYWQLFSAPRLGDTQPVMVMITSGWPIERIAQMLKSKGLIRSSNIFIMIAEIKNLDTKIKHGRYQLSKNMNAAKILDEITNPSKTETDRKSVV